MGFDLKWDESGLRDGHPVAVAGLSDLSDLSLGRHRNEAARSEYPRLNTAQSRGTPPFFAGSPGMASFLEIEAQKKIHSRQNATPDDTPSFVEFTMASVLAIGGGVAVAAFLVRCLAPVESPAEAAG